MNILMYTVLVVDAFIGITILVMMVTSDRMNKAHLIYRLGVWAAGVGLVGGSFSAAGMTVFNSEYFNSQAPIWIFKDISLWVLFYVFFIRHTQLKEN